MTTEACFGDWRKQRCLSSYYASHWLQGGRNNYCDDLGVSCKYFGGSTAQCLEDWVNSKHLCFEGKESRGLNSDNYFNSVLHVLQIKGPHGIRAIIFPLFIGKGNARQFIKINCKISSSNLGWSLAFFKEGNCFSLCIVVQGYLSSGGFCNFALIKRLLLNFKTSVCKLWLNVWVFNLLSIILK